MMRFADSYQERKYQFREILESRRTEIQKQVRGIHNRYQSAIDHTRRTELYAFMHLILTWI